MIRCVGFLYVFAFFVFMFYQTGLSQDTLDVPSIKATHLKTREEYLTFLHGKNPNRYKCQKKYFNKKGEDTLVIIYSVTNERIFSKTSKKYDAYGNICNRIEYKADYKTGGKGVSEKPEFYIELISVSEYKGKGILTARKDYDKDMNLLKSISVEHFYTSAGKPKETIYTSTNRKESYRDVFEYDSLGNKCSYYYYNHDGVCSKLDYEYDSLKRITKITTYKPDFSLKDTEKLFYDEKGRKIRKQTLDNNGKLFLSQKFKYDNHGNLIELVREVCDIPLEFTTLKMTYDKYGNVKTNIKYDSKNKPYRKQEFVYTYYK